MTVANTTTPVPGGAVLFYNSSTLTTLDASAQVLNGIATYSISTLAGGNNIEASYIGGTYNGISFESTSAASVTQNVSSSTSSVVLSSSSNPANYLATMSITATVSGSGSVSAPTGSVTFYVDNQQGPTVQVENGAAVWTNPTLAGGNHTITATYDGDGSYPASSAAPYAQTVSLDTSDITLTESTPYAASSLTQLVTFSAYIATDGSPPTGLVDFYVNNTRVTIEGLNTNSWPSGWVYWSTSSLGLGNNEITAEYSGDANYTECESSIYNDVRTYASTSGVLSPTVAYYGQSATLVVDVVGTGGVMPTGTVIFKDPNGNFLGTATLDDNGQTWISIPVIYLGGDLQYLAYYMGDYSYYATTIPISAQCYTAPTHTSVSFSSSSSTYGANLVITASVTADGSGTPFGLVTFTDQLGTVLGSVNLDANGQAAIDYASLPLDTGAETDTVYAWYDDDAGYDPSANSYNITVTKAPTSFSVAVSDLSSEYGQPETFTATAAGPSGAVGPLGTVTFTAGPSTFTETLTPLAGEGNVSTASVNCDNLPVGDYQITAAYNGNANYLGAAPAAAPLSVASIAPYISVTNTPGTSSYGGAVTLEATAYSPYARDTDIVPTTLGTVSFYSGPQGSETFIQTVPYISSMGGWECTTNTLPLGDTQITATYNGEATLTTRRRRPLRHSRRLSPKPIRRSYRSPIHPIRRTTAKTSPIPRRFRECKA